MDYNELNTFIEFAGEDTLKEIKEKVDNRLDNINTKRQKLAVDNFIKAYKELRESDVIVCDGDDELCLSYFRFYGDNGKEFEFDRGINNADD